MKGVQIGIDKHTTLQIDDLGILCAFFAGAVTTQVTLYKTNRSDHPICPCCWCEEESHIHLFWTCTFWQRILYKYFNDEQLRLSLQLPTCTLRTGLFVITADQADHIVVQHHNPTHNIPWPQHSYPHNLNTHRMMVEILRARNTSDTTDPPDTFDVGHFKKDKSQPDSEACGKGISSTSLHSQRKIDHSQPTIDEEGLWLSTSSRPGGSRYQYVQQPKSTNIYRAIIQAARAVKTFLEQWDKGQAPHHQGSETHREAYCQHPKYS